MELPDRYQQDEALSWYRGHPLAELDADFRAGAAECRDLGVALDVDEALRVWDLAVEASRIIEPPDCWYHGDLVVENLVVDDDGRLSAVLDFGGLAVGNPTVDLVVAWEALDVTGRQVLRRSLDIEDEAWTVSRGWALLIAMITFGYYRTSMPGRCADRLAMAHAAIEG